MSITAVSAARPAGEWVGHDLGTRTVDYDERHAILYALAIGAAATDLDLVFEDRLRVLPTFALTLAQWAPDALGSAGAFNTRIAVHGSQQLQVLAPMPRSGSVTMHARVANVWDKSSAAIFEVAVESDHAVATWSIFAPGRGGFGGKRGPSSPAPTETPADQAFGVATAANQAALYRLLGDRHRMHIDHDAARAAGVARPFLHGLCTLAAITLRLARENDAHPADLVELEGRFAAPVFPGDSLNVRAWSGSPNGIRFDAAVSDRRAISGGRARFAS